MWHRTVIWEKQMNYDHIEVMPIAGALGAEVHGVDLGGEISNSAMAEVRDAFTRNSVVFFPGQDLSPEQHLAFARRFGGIDVNKFFPNVAGFPEVAEVRKEPESKINIGGGWHTDHSYDPEPALGSMLYALEVPDHGGDTMWASMYAAYDALSPGLKQTLAKMTAVHSGARAFGPQNEGSKDRPEGFRYSEVALNEVEHPVICRHPESGRSYLYVNPGFTVRFTGWTVEESRPLLDYLYKHSVRPEFTCRYRWQAKTLAFWDNRCTQHFAINDYHGSRRLMNRVTIEGSAPVAAA
jgi:taurine dioxygenase